MASQETYENLLKAVTERYGADEEGAAQITLALVEKLAGVIERGDIIGSVKTSGIDENTTSIEFKQWDYEPNQE